ncbi:MAG: DUF1553 domain-containing protein [Candidatus Hinthialibacter antarcticus]|nr:DUF1553 domain-containing protein [Candidatus Hinthialibacter antarcticus]
MIVVFVSLGLLPANGQAVDFNFQIRPLLSDRCFTCHGPDENKRVLNLRLDTPEGVFGELLTGEGKAIAPGNPEESVLVNRIRSHEDSYRMPPTDSNLSLTQDEIDLIVAWVEQGAEYKPHWSLIPLGPAGLPQDIALDIDFFIERKLAQNQLAFSEEADNELLLRRLAFDLTGLPPTIEELDAFLDDEAQNAYERAVDRLLASPHYGERMAVDWLDAARYADTYGYQADNFRPAWRWRDWVIEAFNQNMPFDQFIEWQLAGDLEPNPSREQIIATGFNRNHPQNAEGGIINEEYRVEYAADRTNTLGRALMGVTLECARCHDHKFDPISQKDYYQLLSFFNNVDEGGQITWSNLDLPAPTLLLPTDEQAKEIQQYDNRIHSIEDEIDALRSTRKEKFKQWFGSLEQPGAVPSAEAVWPIAMFDFEDASNQRIANTVSDVTGRVLDPVTMGLAKPPLQTVEGKSGNAVQFDGDHMLDFPGLGRFKRGNAFSIGVWVNLPDALADGVIVHSNRGGIIYSFKGFQLSLSDHHFDVRLSANFPYNSIHLLSEHSAPKQQWIHLLATYDGSSKASGTRLYVNGVEQAMTVKRDNLYRDIVFDKEGIGTNLRAGARWRSKGMTGGRMDELALYDRALTAFEARAVAGKSRDGDWLPTPMSEEERNELYDYYAAAIDEDASRLRNELEQARLERNALVEDVEEVMVMAEMPQPRQAYLLKRGAYDQHGEEVFPDTPQSIMAFRESMPKNRLGLSQWLTHPKNPLTARVIVNRLWQQFFGTGIVKTAEDFGSQGDLPSHPELLDWLAMEFIHSGWDVKALVKQIVTTRVYRQSSIASDRLREIDPDNRLLARGPARRLSAEMLRDQSLAASGLWVETIGGPSVKPYQPEGLWAFGMNPNYNQDTGDKLYRRSLYTFWKRTVPPPSMNLFDAPSRSVCTVRRQQTNTPLQALVVMNDPQFVEAARVLAQRIMKLRETPNERIALAFRLLATRRPRGQESGILMKLYNQQLKAFQSDPSKMQGWLHAGESVRDESLDEAELAAYAVVVNAIQNSDASLMQR